MWPNMASLAFAPHKTYIGMNGAPRFESGRTALPTKDKNTLGDFGEVLLKVLEHPLIVF